MHNKGHCFSVAAILYRFFQGMDKASLAVQFLVCYIATYLTNRSENYCDNSVACQKKQTLSAHMGVCVAGELDFFDHFGNLYHAYAFGVDSNA